MKMQSIKTKSIISYIAVAMLIVATVVLFAACGGKKVESLQVTTQPTKTTYYVGEYFDSRGMILTAELGDGTKESVIFADNNDANNDGYTYDKYKKPLTVEDTVVTFSYGGKTATQNITVLKRNVQAPTEQEVLYTTSSNSITITSLSGAEYKIGDGVWQDSNTFGGLGAGRTYSISVRYKETDATYASEVTTVQITTSKGIQSAISESELQITFDSPTQITISPIEGAEYSIDGGDTWQDSNVFTDMTAGATYDVSIRRKETDTMNPSAATTKTIVMQKFENEQVLPELTTSNITGTSITLNAIEGAEYKLGENGTWQDSLTFSNLAPVTEYTIFVRYKETDTVYASDPVSYTFTTTKGEQEAIWRDEVSIVKTTTSITINPIAGAEYKLDNGEWGATREFTDLTPGSVHTVYIRLAETDRFFASPETAIEVTLATE